MVTSKYPKPNKGDVFGELTVIENIKLPGRWMVRLQCSCGDDSVLQRLGHLYGSKSKPPVRHCVKCGKKAIGLKQRDCSDKQARTAVWHNYRTKAAERNLVWDLSKEQFWYVAEEPCVYCGNEGTSYFKQPKSSPWASPYVYTGVDRIDSKVGYVYSNVQPCCKWCNMAKSNRTEEEFLSWIRTVYYAQRAVLG